MCSAQIFLLLLARYGLAKGQKSMYSASFLKAILGKPLAVCVSCFVGISSGSATRPPLAVLGTDASGPSGALLWTRSNVVKRKGEKGA